MAMKVLRKLKDGIERVSYEVCMLRHSDITYVRESVLIYTTCCAFILGVGVCSFTSRLSDKYFQRIQTRNVIGDPNRLETFTERIDPNGNVQKFYGTIDGINVEDYVNMRN